jgi:hypothetical protein
MPHPVKRWAAAYGAGYCMGWLVSDYLIERAAGQYARRRRSLRDHPAGTGRPGLDDAGSSSG